MIGNQDFDRDASGVIRRGWGDPDEQKTETEKTG
jgi:hypothetical protein